MLEKYEKGFDEKKFIEDFMISKEIATKKDAMKDLRKQIKKNRTIRTRSNAVCRRNIQKLLSEKYRKEHTARQESRTSS